MSGGNKDVDPTDYFGEYRELFVADCRGCDHRVEQPLPESEVGTDLHKWIRCASCGTINWAPRASAAGVAGDGT